MKMTLCVGKRVWANHDCFNLIGWECGAEKEVARPTQMWNFQKKLYNKWLQPKPAHWFIFSSTLIAQSGFSKKLPETRGQVKSLNCLLTVQTTLLFDTVAIMSLKNLVDYLYSLFKLQTTNFKFSYIFQWSGRGVPHAILTLIISFLTIEKQNMINDILHSLPVN